MRWSASMLWWRGAGRVEALCNTPASARQFRWPCRAAQPVWSRRWLGATTALTRSPHRSCRCGKGGYHDEGMVRGLPALHGCLDSGGIGQERHGAHGATTHTPHMTPGQQLVRLGWPSRPGLDGRSVVNDPLWQLTRANPPRNGAPPRRQPRSLVAERGVGGQRCRVSTHWALDQGAASSRHCRWSHGKHMFT